MNNLSDRIRLMRKAQKLSQNQLAALVGITQPFMSDIESGKRRPSLEVLEKFCDALGCSADYLLGIPHEESPKELAQNKLPGALTPEILRIITERNLSENELLTAIKVADVMRDQKR